MATSFFVGAVVGTEIIRILSLSQNSTAFRGVASSVQCTKFKIPSCLPDYQILLMYLPRNQCINLRNKLKRELKKTMFSCYVTNLANGLVTAM